MFAVGPVDPFEHHCGDNVIDNQLAGRHVRTLRAERAFLERGTKQVATGDVGNLERIDELRGLRSFSCARWADENDAHTTYLAGQLYLVSHRAFLIGTTRPPSCFADR